MGLGGGRGGELRRAELRSVCPRLGAAATAGGCGAGASAAEVDPAAANPAGGLGAGRSCPLYDSRGGAPREGEQPYLKLKPNLPTTLLMKNLIYEKFT